MRMILVASLSWTLSLGSFCLLACTTPGQVGVKTPQARGNDYPPAFELTAAQQQEAETAWRTLLAEFQLPETKFDAEPGLHTPRALPLALAGRINLSKTGAQLDALAAKEALRRFIERNIGLLSGGGRELSVSLKDLSLLTFSNEGSMYRAVYQQRSFPYPLVNGFGELTLIISKTGTLLQWNSRLLPKLDLPTRTLIEAKGLSDKFIGRTFNYNSFAGQPLSYKASKREDIAVKDLVVYPKQTGTRLTLHLAYPVEVGDGMTWTVYVDAVTGDELEVKQNFAT